MNSNVFNSNKVARDLCSQFGLQQCVILCFSDARGYEVVAAGGNQEDSQTATEVATGLKEGLDKTGLPVRLIL